MNWKILFRPVCWMQEIYRTFYYNALVSGHDFIEKDDGTLECEICGLKAKLGE